MTEAQRREVEAKAGAEVLRSSRWESRWKSRQQLLDLSPWPPIGVPLGALLFQGQGQWQSPLADFVGSFLAKELLLEDVVESVNGTQL